MVDHDWGDSLQPNTLGRIPGSFYASCHNGKPYFLTQTIGILTYLNTRKFNRTQRNWKNMGDSHIPGRSSQGCSLEESSMLLRTGTRLAFFRGWK